MKREMARKRQLDRNKQARKVKIAKEAYGLDYENRWISEPHRLSKGKVHCSCDMCAAKTKTLGWKHSDIKNMRESNDEELEFLYNIRKKSFRELKIKK